MQKQNFYNDFITYFIFWVESGMVDFARKHIIDNKNRDEEQQGLFDKICALNGAPPTEGGNAETLRAAAIEALMQTDANTMAHNMAMITFSSKYLSALNLRKIDSGLHCEYAKLLSGLT